jgi:hypothetical protein
MDSINDSVFGELDFNGGWVREIEVAFLGVKSSVEVIVEGNDDDETIFDEQRDAFQQLPEAIVKAEGAALAHYQSVTEDFRAQFGEQADIKMPRIQTQSELAKLVKLTGIVFPMVLDRGEVTVGFLLECSWDPEHGLGVRIVNGESEVGTQDLLT